MSDNAPSTNLTIDALRSGSAVQLTPGSNARTRDEIRANAAKTSTADRAKLIQQKLGENPAAPAEGSPQSAAPEAPETDPAEDLEAPSAAPTDDGQAHDDDAEDYDVPDRLDAFAKDLDLDPEYLGGLRATVKVNGEEREVTVAEAFAGYQHATANQEKAQRLAAAQRRHEAEATERIAAYTKLVEEGKVAQVAAVQALRQELERPEVQALKTSNPQDFIFWQDLVNQRVAMLQTSFQQLNARQAQVQEEHLNQLKQQGLARLRESISDFDTPERFRKIEGVFSEFGAGAEDLSTVLDDRILLLASKYADAKAELAALKAEKEQGRKKARQLVDKNRPMDPGARRSSSQDTRKKLDAAKQNIKGKRGPARTRAVAGALLTAVQEGRKRRGR